MSEVINAMMSCCVEVHASDWEGILKDLEAIGFRKVDIGRSLPNYDLFGEMPEDVEVLKKMLAIRGVVEVSFGGVSAI